MEEKLNLLIKQKLNISDCAIEEASMKTVREWNSLTHISLVMAIEEEFGLDRLQPDEIVEMTSVSGIKKLLRLKGIQI